MPCVKLKGLWPVVMHGIPQLWTTGERGYAGHKGRESAIRAKKDILRWPRVVTPHKASCLRRNVCCLKQPSTASRVRVSRLDGAVGLDGAGGGPGGVAGIGADSGGVALPASASDLPWR